MTVHSLAVSLLRVLLSFELSTSFFFFLLLLLLLWFRMKEGRREGRGGVDEGRKSRGAEGEGRSFVCGPRGVLGQLGARRCRVVCGMATVCLALRRLVPRKHSHKQFGQLYAHTCTESGRIACKRSPLRPSLQTDPLQSHAISALSFSHFRLPFNVTFCCAVQHEGDNISRLNFDLFAILDLANGEEESFRFSCASSCSGNLSQRRTSTLLNISFCNFHYLSSIVEYRSLLTAFSLLRFLLSLYHAEL